MFLNNSVKSGFGFGLASGIITTLGLIVGLNAGSSSKAIIISGVLTIAIADAFSDALGVHIAEETKGIHTHTEIWMATFSTLVSKFIFAVTFIIPLAIFSVSHAIVISVVWGLSVLSIFSFFMARDQGERPWKVVTEHLLIAVLVIFLTHFAGILIKKFFPC